MLWNGWQKTRASDQNIGFISSTPLREPRIIDEAIDFLKSQVQLRFVQASCARIPMKWFIKVGSILEELLTLMCQTSQGSQQVYIPDGYVDIRRGLCNDADTIHG